jgi:hypothetical protein
MNVFFVLFISFHLEIALQRRKEEKRNRHYHKQTTTTTADVQSVPVCDDEARKLK